MVQNLVKDNPAEDDSAKWNLFEDGPADDAQQQTSHGNPSFRDGFASAGRWEPSSQRSNQFPRKMSSSRTISPMVRSSSSMKIPPFPSKDVPLRVAGGRSALQQCLGNGNHHPEHQRSGLVHVNPSFRFGFAPQGLGGSVLPDDDADDNLRDLDSSLHLITPLISGSFRPLGRWGGAQSPSSVWAMAIITLSAILVFSFMLFPPFWFGVALMGGRSLRAPAKSGR